MADTLTWKNKSTLSWSTVETPGTDIGDVTDSAELEYDETMADGVGASQADVLWRERKTIGTGVITTYDLTNLAMTLFGYGTNISLTFVTLKGVLIVNESTTAGEDLSLDNNNANGHLDMFHAADSSLHIPADSVLKVTNKMQGWTVGGTTKKLRVTNNGVGNVTYRIAFVGTTA